MADNNNQAYLVSVEKCIKQAGKMADMGTLQGDGRAWDVLRWIERSGNLARDGPDVSRA